MGGSLFVPSQPGGNVTSSMMQARYSSLFGGTLPTSDFTRGASLPWGNPTASTMSYPGHSHYVSPTTQSSPSFHPRYNPISSHNFGGPFLSRGFYPWGKDPSTSHPGPQ